MGDIADTDFTTFCQGLAAHYDTTHIILITAAPPCKDHSRVRDTPPGLSGDDGSLLQQMTNIDLTIRQNLPQYTVRSLMENVLPHPAIRSQFDDISRQLGYKPIIVDAADGHITSRPRLWWLDADWTHITQPYSRNTLDNPLDTTQRLRQTTQPTSTTDTTTSPRERMGDPCNPLPTTTFPLPHNTSADRPGSTTTTTRQSRQLHLGPVATRQPTVSTVAIPTTIPDPEARRRLATHHTTSAWTHHGTTRPLHLHHRTTSIHTQPKHHARQRLALPISTLAHHPTPHPSHHSRNPPPTHLLEHPETHSDMACLQDTLGATTSVSQPPTHAAARLEQSPSMGQDHSRTHSRPKPTGSQPVLGHRPVTPTAQHTRHQTRSHQRAECPRHTPSRANTTMVRPDTSTLPASIPTEQHGDTDPSTHPHLTAITLPTHYTTTDRTQSRISTDRGSPPGPQLARPHRPEIHSTNFPRRTPTTQSRIHPQETTTTTSRPTLATHGRRDCQRSPTRTHGRPIPWPTMAPSPHNTTPWIRTYLDPPTTTPHRSNHCHGL